MKKLLLIIVAILSILSSKAQDVIVLKNTENIKVKVKSIGENEVTYLKWDNLEGPVYSLSKSHIFYIQYANGQKDIFFDPIAAKKEINSKFQNYIYLGGDFTVMTGGPSLDLSFGARTSKCFYIGGGIGVHNLLSLFYERYTISYLAFSSDIKGYIPTNVEDFYPRLDFSFGGLIDVLWPSAGVFMSIGAGFDYRRFSLGIGYQMPITDHYIIPSGYVRLGMRFGKK